MKQVRPSYVVKTLREVEAEHVKHAIELFGWNMSRAAVALDIDRRTLYRILQRNKITRPEVES